MPAIDTDPLAAYEVHRQGLRIAQDTGNRLLETYHVGNLSRLAAKHGDPRRPSTSSAMAIRNYFDSGNFSLLRPATGGASRLS